jgi:hypothetical protein
MFIVMFTPPPQVRVWDPRVSEGSLVRSSLASHKGWVNAGDEITDTSHKGRVETGDWISDTSHKGRVKAGD